MILLKLLFWAACAAALAFAGIWIAVCICAWRPRKHESADCLIVLGAKLHPDGSMSRSLQCRCDAALDAWRRGVAETIIVCGGQVRDAPCSEASAMKRYMIAAGVSEACILMEDRSVNTFENMRNTRAIMEERGLARAALVTSDYHLERALWLCRVAGVNAKGGIPAACPMRPMHYLKARTRETISWILFAKCEINKKLHK